MTRKKERRLSLKKETLAALGSLDPAALARVAGAGSITCDENTYSDTTANSLSGSRKC